MTTAKPSLELLRSLTDEHVLSALISERRLTRAELATRTGISKPTVSDSVRRLTAAGLLRDTGERTTGRGGVGSYYALSERLGSALVVSIAPDGIVAETVDVHGEVISREHESVPRSARPVRIARALHAVAERAQSATSARSRLAVVSAADPVDRSSGRLVQLPDSPFLIGDLDPVGVLAELVDGPVTVDNDVHWAARAERHAARPGTLDDFAYLYLGDGLGCAIVADGDVRRGHRGFAGEIAHVLTYGPGGRAVHFIDVFAELGLRRQGSTAVDTEALLSVVQKQTARARTIQGAIAGAVCGVLTALVTVSDPQRVVIGGTWGVHAAVLDRIIDEFARQPRHVPVQATQLTDEPSLRGARERGLRDLRAAILASTQPRP
jgi:predicted NBD/HSP70 family sugar kinase